MIGSIFENYDWNWNIGNWFNFLSSKRAFFRFFFCHYSLFWLVFCSFLSISRESSIFFNFFGSFTFYFFQMQRKTFFLGFVGLMGVLIALAYAAGKQSNRLSAEQTNFNGYQSENHAKRLTAQVWDATMNALTTWAKNHESRLQVHGSVPGYPNLTQEQLSFSNLLSTQHNNALTAQMRDGLLNKLTTTITNHEMRLRALEKKSDTVKTPVAKCVGEYQAGERSEFYGKKAPSGIVSCWGLDSY